MKRYAHIFPIAVALFFMVLSFCIEVHANNEKDFELTIFSAEQQAIKREINSTQFEKDISLVLKFIINLSLQYIQYVLFHLQLLC